MRSSGATCDWSNVRISGVCFAAGWLCSGDGFRKGESEMICLSCDEEIELGSLGTKGPVWLRRWERK